MSIHVDTTHTQIHNYHYTSKLKANGFSFIHFLSHSMLHTVYIFLSLSYNFISTIILFHRNLSYRVKRALFFLNVWLFFRVCLSGRSASLSLDVVHLEFMFTTNRVRPTFSNKCVYQRVYTIYTKRVSYAICVYSFFFYSFLHSKLCD